jgi:hypothetical protein
MEAKDAGLLRDEGFPSVENSANDEAFQQMTEVLGYEAERQAQTPYLDVVIETAAWFRNRFAHPSMQTILTPGQALDGLILAAQIINQLWPIPVTE